MVKKLKLQSCLDLFREEAATRLLMAIFMLVMMMLSKLPVRGDIQSE